MKKIIFSFLFTCLSALIFAQADLTSTLEALKGQLVEVETKSASFSQTLEWGAEKPNLVTLTIQETSKKKGKEKVMSYVFGLQDVDVNAIRSKTNKDIVEVNIFMKSKQKLVVFSENAEFKNYVAKFKVFAENADNGKEIEKLLKQAVKEAKKYPSSCPTTALEGYQWMKDNISDFSVGDIAKNQRLEINGSVVDYTLVTKGKKSKQEQWVFNLADLKKHSVKLQIKSKEFYVEVKTRRNLKYIRYQKEESKTSYTNKVRFYTADFEKAKCLLTVLESVIDDSEKNMKANRPTYSSADQALAALAGYTGTVAMEKYKITQELKAACATTLVTSEEKGSSKAKDKEFKFNFVDMKPKKMEIKVKGDLVMLYLGTAKNKLIQAYKDGELASYTNKMSIVAPDIETAKLMKIAAIASAEQCEKEVGFKGFASAKENFDWLEKTLKEHVVPEHEQRMELIDGENCKWKFVSVKSGKKNVEEVFEFNLEDLAEKKVKWAISGKKLAIQINTKYKEKNIKYYKDGEPGNYKNSFSIEFIDLEAARNTISAFQQAIEACKG